ncbi:hypothetical protein ABB37_00526 [Leptomonas pyrrhocoris]|uniref:Uncharacterized protein n=1 Tax=Leptomonas pyrrhocoris TaxID=157538 RepID=A0A0N0E0D6_LEPPY|nr:hypothetical protein ABB37_00526 [Leptomonas pyrrhocoris]XP_015664747.1 hypothetical protein ABB37_00526 [Leptomonas pyrrhocoris]KPA86307.1 hypothetical protein ABB37_00526 [Leptomonas pyrrhocoris]KPA86308.1 hypothetical protein ABB37_00526 [Leptomonas pyrrhocoris]|eukprot:XP_015664746.1 hypothetical protein ABB37_00526 [Leptomonas pyrrhocoris]
MLGSQSWYTALAIPTVVIGGFVATRKRLAYQWREELMDMEGTAYPTVTDADMGYFRRVAPATAVEAAETLTATRKGPVMTSPPLDASAAAAGALGVQLTAQDNIGMSVRSNALLPEIRNVLLNEVQRWSQTLGNSLDPRKVTAIETRWQAALENDAASAEQPNAASSSSLRNSQPSSTAAVNRTRREWTSRFNFDFLRRVRVIADHAEDIQPMKAPWGCGDHMRLEQMPASLRYLVRHTQQAFEGMGRLRHVYIEYSPTGQFFRAPRPPKMYDGHDYVIIPLRRDGCDTVVTMSPVLRSRMSDLREVALNSWTSRDVDALVPPGCMLRVYGTARYEWGWGVRPGPTWFGSRLNSVAAPLHTSALASGDAASPLWSWRRWRQPLFALWKSAGPVCNSSISAKASSAPRDAALIVLHYEGPRSSNKQRSLLLQPEIWIFGQPPSIETYETWYEDRPTADSVKEEGLLRFMIRNYFDMLTVS